MVKILVLQRADTLISQEARYQLLRLGIPWSNKLSFSHAWKVKNAYCYCNKNNKEENIFPILQAGNKLAVNERCTLLMYSVVKQVKENHKY